MPQVIIEAKGCDNSTSTLAIVLQQAVEAASSTDRAQGLDVGRAGFWLRGIGLRKHAKLAASSKRISESSELN